MARTINLRGIPEDLFRDFKIACAANDTDMTSALKILMGEYVRSGNDVAGKCRQDEPADARKAGRRGSKNG